MVAVSGGYGVGHKTGALDLIKAFAAAPDLGS